MGQDIELLFVNRVMELMEEAYDIILNYDYAGEDKRKFEIIKELSALTVELLKKKDINNKMKKIAESSKINGDNVEEKFNTFKMIRNVIHHFPIFKSWEEVYISYDLLEWNESKSDQIKNYFKTEKEFSYIIYLHESGEWVPKINIDIRTPKLEKSNKIYLKDILTLNDALWTFGVFDYYLQLLGLNIKTRFLASV